jgi:ADP-ribose pyrophosphatase YjhB (NUDIX family)
VAFPGGKRDKEDDDDLEAAMRETLEEVGLDLEKEEGFPCGHLPDRVVTTGWGAVPYVCFLQWLGLFGMLTTRKADGSLPFHVPTHFTQPSNASFATYRSRIRPLDSPSTSPHSGIPHRGNVRRGGSPCSPWS